SASPPGPRGKGFPSARSPRGRGWAGPPRPAGTARRTTARPSPDRPGTPPGWPAPRAACAPRGLPPPERCRGRSRATLRLPRRPHPAPPSGSPHGPHQKAPGRPPSSPPRVDTVDPPCYKPPLMPYLSNNFGLLDPEASDYETSRVAVLPVPFERTTSYGKGTTSGPAAILRASQAMELYDEELGAEPYTQGIATLPPFLPEAFDMGEGLAELQEACKAHMERGKFLVTLGGEHSLTQAPVKAAREVFGEIGVVQFDAHSDLREEFEGTPFSHASVMKRVVDAGIPLLAVGIRSLSAPEARLIREKSLPVIWGHQLDR